MQTHRAAAGSAVCVHTVCNHSGIHSVGTRAFPSIFSFFPFFSPSPIFLYMVIVDVISCKEKKRKRQGKELTQPTLHLQYTDE